MANKILIIEDNIDDRDLIRMFLNREGFKDILEANNGDVGIQLINKEHPKVVILDTNLPGIDGFEVCRQIQCLENINVKVIMMTGAKDPVDSDKAKKFGAEDYCVKSFDCSEIIEAVKTNLCLN